MSEALQQLQKQSGNAITDLREQLGAEVTNPALDLDIAGQAFFEALDQIARLAEVTTTFSTGDGTIGIMAAAPMDAPPARLAPPEAKPLVQYTGPFRIELKQLSLNRDFATGAATANVQLEAAWEPRLRPMLLKLKYDELKIVDDRKKEVKPQVDDGSRRSRGPAREPVGRDQSQPRRPRARRQEARLAQGARPR